MSAFTASSSDGTAALRGEHNNTTGSVFGVAGSVNSSNVNSAGVLGNNAGAGYGVFGQNAGTGVGTGGLSVASQGIYGQTDQGTDNSATIGATTFDGVFGGLTISTDAAGTGFNGVGDGMSLAADMNYLLNGTGVTSNGFDVGGFTWGANPASTQVIGQYNTYNTLSFGVAALNQGFAGAFPIVSVDFGSFNSAFDFGAVGTADLDFGVGVQGEGWVGVAGLGVANTFGDDVGVLGQQGTFPGSVLI